MKNIFKKNNKIVFKNDPESYIILRDLVIE